MNIAVRPARSSDVAAVLAFATDVVPRHYEPILGADAAQGQLRWWTSERMTSAIAAGRVHVAVSGESIVGVCETGEFGGEQVIWKLYIAPHARGCGVGVALVEHAVAALPADTDHVALEHFAGNTRAAAFYDREGFEVVRTDAPDSGDPAGAVVWRRRDLKPRSRPLPRNLN